MVKYEDESKETLEKRLHSFVRFNELNNVKEFLSNPKIKHKININCSNGELLRTACYQGYLDLAKVLLMNGADIHITSSQYPSYSMLDYACISGNIQLVEYLLISPELKEHASIKENQYSALFSAINYSHIDLIHYLLNSPSLKEKADVTAQNGEAILRACVCFNYEPNERNKKIYQYILEEHNKIKPLKDVYYEGTGSLLNAIGNNLMGNQAVELNKEALGLLYPYFLDYPEYIEESIFKACVDGLHAILNYYIYEKEFYFTNEFIEKILNNKYIKEEIKFIVQKIKLNRKLNNENKEEKSLEFKMLHKEKI